MVSYVLKKYGELQKLINQKEKDGNTPLHLATKSHHPNVVSTLTWNKRINLNLINNENLTARDIASNNVLASFRGILTWTALKSAGAQTSRESQQRNKDGVTDENFKDRDSMPHFIKISKDRANTLSLVATIIVTVTFTAGFTMPGGYNNSDPNQGMSTFLKKDTFHIFVICNAMAMYISILSVIILTWGTLGGVSLVVIAPILAEPLLVLALIMMSFAFMAGIYLVVSGLPWLAIVVLLVGIIFAVIIVALFILFFPITTSSSRIARYITYYLFPLVVLASESHG